MNPYLDTLSPGAYARLPRAERVVLQLLRDRRLPEARLAARGLGYGVAPRRTTADPEGRVYWGDRVPDTVAARRELDLTELEPDTRPFSGAPFRHEITGIARVPGAGACVELTVRTYDPALRLPVGPQRASLLISPGRRRLTVPFRLDPVRPGVFQGAVRLDLGEARLPLSGFAGARHPLVRLTGGGQSNQALLLAPWTSLPDRPCPLPLRCRPARGDDRAGGAQPGPAPGAVGAGRPHRARPPGRRPPGPPRMRRAGRLVAGALR